MSLLFRHGLKAQMDQEHIQHCLGTSLDLSLILCFIILSTGNCIFFSVLSAHFSDNSLFSEEFYSNMTASSMMTLGK